MNISAKDLRAMARTKLKGNYGTLIGAYLLYEIISSVINSILGMIGGAGPIFRFQNNHFILADGKNSIISLIISVIVSLIISVLLLGFNKMYLDGSRGYNIKFDDLFYGFRHHPDRVILMQLILTLVSFICILPASICGALLYYTDLDSTPLIITVSILTVVGCIVLIFVSIGFSQAMFLLADYDDIGPMQALKESLNIMNGHKRQYLLLNLSFIGYFLLTLMTCYIAFLWVYPYLMMTHAFFYRSITKEL